jgi:predicted amidohydrolase YtcJ
MKHSVSATLMAGLLLAVAGAAMVRGQQAAVDTVLMNGKIITVDDRFSIAQAVAIRGDRFVAVGSNQDIARLAGPNTRRIDLGGKAVVPGLIDAHAHLMRAAETWAIEARFDGVESRKQALDLVRAKAAALGPGQWVYNLGGWSFDQFADNRTPLTRAELDQAAPNNPVYLQFTRCCAFMNSKAVEAMDLAGVNQPWVEKDAAGKPTGRINDPGLAQIASKIPRPAKETFATNAMALLRDLNRAGITTAGISGCPQEASEFFRELEHKGELTFRFMCMVAAGSPTTGVATDQVQRAAAQIAEIKLFQGDNYIDDVMYGETIALSDNMLSPHTSYTPEQLTMWRTLATEVAKAGLPLQQHVTISETFPAFLDQIEIINKQYPIRNLRWAFAHMDQVSAHDLDRMKKLGMWAAVRAIEPVMGAIFNRVHGERSIDMPPLRMIQDSGIKWGFHTDTTEVNQYRPFTTLWFAVTGKMLGGAVVNRQTITREEALIAHTRSNSYFVMRENDLGSIQPGKLADLVVMDRDYLTIPADQIKDIKPVITMVGGKVAYDAKVTTATK